jgi:hypothetical protein
MTTAYKLTDADIQTHGDYQWVVGEWRETSGVGGGGGGVGGGEY